MYCPNCGKQIPDVSRFCTACGASLGDPAPTPAPEPAAAPAPAAPARAAIKERVGPGVIGMLLGVILVLIAVIAGESMGIWVGIQGLYMGLAVFSGYRMLSRRLGVPGTVICAVGTVAAAVMAEAFVWMLLVETVPVHMPESGFGLLWTLLRGGLGGSFCIYLAQAVLFALAGGVLLAVPDLRAQRLHPDRMPKLRPGLIFLVLFLLAVACYVLFATSGNNEAPVNSYAYQTVTHFMRGYAAAQP